MQPAYRTDETKRNPARCSVRSWRFLVSVQQNPSQGMIDDDLENDVSYTLFPSVLAQATAPPIVSSRRKSGYGA